MDLECRECECGLCTIHVIMNVPELALRKPQCPLRYIPRWMQVM